MPKVGHLVVPGWKTLTMLVTISLPDKLVPNVKKNPHSTSPSSLFFILTTNTTTTTIINHKHPFITHSSQLVMGGSEHEHDNTSQKTALSKVPSDSGVSPLDDLKVDLDSMKKRLHEERARHKEAIKLVRDAASNSLQAGLTPIFKTSKGFHFKGGKSSRASQASKPKCRGLTEMLGCLVCLDFMRLHLLVWIDKDVEQKGIIHRRFSTDRQFCS